MANRYLSTKIPVMTTRVGPPTGERRAAQVYDTLRLDSMRRNFDHFLHELWFDRDPTRTTLHRTVPLDPYSLDMADYAANGPPLRGILAKRGFGKTVLITTALMLFRLFQDHERRILITTQNQAFARRLIRVGRQWITEIPFLKHLQPEDGDWDSNSQFQVGPAAVRHTASVTALGIEGMLPGNHAHTIIADDVETNENTKTLTARDELDERCNEFVSILEPDLPNHAPSEIIFVGTYHHHDSLYLRRVKKGFAFRSYPLVYPEPTEKVVGLAPIFAAKLADGSAKPGDLTMPERYGQKYADRRRRTGKLHFLMQECLVSNTNDVQQYPLSLSDFIVVDHVDRDFAPVHIAWGTTDHHGNSTAREDIENCSLFEDDRFYAPIPAAHASDTLPYQRTIAYIDPAGRGRDETGLTVIGVLAGRLWIKCCTGFQGGWDQSALARLCDTLRAHAVSEAYIEDNYSRGMFQSMLEPVLKAHFLEPSANSALFPNGWKCALTPVSAVGQKEVRIISSLDAPLSNHRLVIGADTLRPTPSLDRDCELQYQLSAVSAERNCLTRDDRIDSLAGAVRCCEEHLRLDTAKAELRAQERAFDDLFLQHQLAQGWHVKPPRFFQHRHAFTIVELLVSVCICGILSALVVMGLSGVRHTARRIVCQANQRSIAVAAFAVSDERRGLPMPEQGLLGSGTPLFNDRLGISSVLVCPEDQSFAPTLGGSFLYLPLGWVQSAGQGRLSATLARRSNLAITMDAYPSHPKPDQVNSSLADGSCRAGYGGSPYNPSR